MSEEAAPSAPAVEKGPVSSVLLIDGDNDPHFPPDFPITQHTLVRVFIRPGAKMPRGLERRLGDLPMCVPVISSKGGANAADFVMSLHAGLLHSVLPMSIPFTLVTADKTLAAMAQELQRLGRLASIWTSHPDGGRRRRPAAAKPAQEPRRRRPPRAARPPAAAPPAPAAGGAGKPPRSLAEVAASYAARLARMKNPPSRLKALLNDIQNRSNAPGLKPEDILEELKRSHGLKVDENGRIARQ